jgi:hypothetical protein
MRKSSALCVSAIALALAMPLKASAQGVSIYIGPGYSGYAYPAYPGYYGGYPAYGYAYPSYGYAYPSYSYGYGYGRPGPIGVKGVASELIGDGTVGIRA